jgi:SAM-dependent methyltransferase
LPDNKLRSLQTHDFPRIFFKYPGLIRIAYGIHYLNQLRKWYVVGKLNQLAGRVKSSHFTFIDAGCGEGQYMFPLAARFPQAKIIGIDKSAGNIDFANEYIRRKPFPNVSVIQGTIEEASPVDAGDIVMCIGVLHFVDDDRRAMHALASMVKPGGALLLEVPVNGKIIFPLYRWALNKYGNYDTINARKRTYLPAEVSALVAQSGLKVRTVTYAYGTLGKLGHELYNTSLVILLNGNTFERIVSGIIINLLYPLTLILYTLDYCIKHKDGNCMIIVAEKEIV